ncbi:hypothetical protein NQD34_013061 [Periophthalmus magnuspinnatus]|nr:hypothetical protein NQD34_013061 [Periophthalmus magnuspinnatus]
MEGPVVKKRRYSGHTQSEDTDTHSSKSCITPIFLINFNDYICNLYSSCFKGKWILLALVCFIPISVIKALSIYFHIRLGAKCQNATTERQVLQSTLESLNHQITEEKAKLEQGLLEIDNYTSKGWLYFQGSVYLGSTTEQTWQKSRQYCQKRGADLTIINSVQEQEFECLHFPENRWIGLSDIEQEGIWKWVDGSLLNISFWSTDEPNDANSNEDCGEIKYRGTLRNWNDLRCAEKRNFICEKIILK